MTGQIGDVMTEQITEPEVEWNPTDIKAGETIWVYKYWKAGDDDGWAPLDVTTGYDIKVTYGTRDSDGDVYVSDGHPYSNFAHKWRRPPADAVEHNPTVEPGDWVKVTDVLSAAQPGYRNGVMGKVAQVVPVPANRGGAGNGIYVHMPHEWALGGEPGFITGWERAEDPTTKVAPDKTGVMWNPDTTIGAKVKVYQYGTGYISPDEKTDEHGPYDLRFVAIANRDADGDIMLQSSPSHSLKSSYARKWAQYIPDGSEVVEPQPVTGQTEEPGTNWELVISQWRDALHDYACQKEWCSEYEDTVKKLFGWDVQRAQDWDVSVRLEKQGWFSDVVDAEEIFGREVDKDDLEDEHYTFIANITITVSASGSEPTRDEVREALDDQYVKYDNFTINDYELSEN